MKFLERYEIEQTSRRITINLNQKKNAVVNMVISVGIIVLSLWLLLTSNNPSSFYYVLLGVGILWLIGAIAGFRQKRSYRLTNRHVEYQSSGRSKTHKLSASDLSYVLLQKIVRPTGGEKTKTPLPWRVKLIDNAKKEFKGEFKFQNEERARKLSSMIAGFYEVNIRSEEI